MEFERLQKVKKKNLQNHQKTRYFNRFITKKLLLKRATNKSNPMPSLSRINCLKTKNNKKTRYQHLGRRRLILWTKWVQIPKVKIVSSSNKAKQMNNKSISIWRILKELLSLRDLAKVLVWKPPKKKRKSI